MQSRVAESFLQSVAGIVSPFRVYSGVAKLIVRGGEVLEVPVVGVIDINFEGDHNEDGRNSDQPQQGLESVLQTDGCITMNNCTCTRVRKQTH